MHLGFHILSITFHDNFYKNCHILVERNAIAIVFVTGMFSRIWKSRSNLWNAQNGEIIWRCEFRISIDIVVPVWEYYSQCTHIDAIIGNPSSWERVYHIVPPIANLSLLQTALQRAGLVYVYWGVRSWLCWYHHFTIIINS